MRETGGPSTVEHELISRLLRLEVLNKAKGKCEKCGKRLFRKRKYASITRYDKIARESTHTWRRDGRKYNIALNNLELVCDICYHELKTTKETLEVWISPATKVDVEVPPGTHKLLGDLLKTAKPRTEAIKVKSRRY